jgi:DNA polymerase-3 subunit delta'
MPQIVGNDALRRKLCRDIRESALSHAYIIEGPTGSGRHTIALMAAAALACEKKSDARSPLPCLECPSCKKIIEGKSPDVIYISREDKASLGIDAARFIKEDVRTLPNDLDDKIYIVEDADRMTHQAQNAILLTLEEPPSFVHFFLLCNDSSALLETIRSRAPIFRTEAIPIRMIDEYICAHDTRAKQLKLSSPREYNELLVAANGGIGKALQMLEEKSRGSVFENRSLISDFLSAAIESPSARNLVPFIPRFLSSRDQLHISLLLLTNALRDLILLKKSDSVSLSFFSDKNQAIELCDKTTLSFLYSMYNAVTVALEENEKNSNSKLTLTKMLVSAKLI